MLSLIFYGRSAKDLTGPSLFGNILNLFLKSHFSSDQELKNAIFSIVIKTVHYSWKMLCDIYCLSEIIVSVPSECVRWD
jgi:putative lipase involved disintegration of autophagic bodies